MPIKYQALGGGGDSQTLVITTSPNLQVKLSNEKYSKTITTNEHGQAKFKNLKAGVYSLVVTLSNGDSFTKEIVIDEFIDEKIGELKRLKDVQKKQKLKLSNGRTYSIIGKNLSWHKPNTNSITLMADIAIGAYTWNASASDRDCLAEENENIYKSLIDYEKKRIIKQTYTHSGGSTEAYFVTVSKNEVNNPNAINSQTDRVRKNEEGRNTSYWLRTTGRGGNQTIVSVDGTFNNEVGPQNNSEALVSIFDVYGDTWVSKGADGYWHILNY